MKYLARKKCDNDTDKEKILNSKVDSVISSVVEQPKNDAKPKYDENPKNNENPKNDANVPIQ